MRTDQTWVFAFLASIDLSAPLRVFGCEGSKGGQHEGGVVFAGYDSPKHLKIE
jgi:hypothetical protein